MSNPFIQIGNLEFEEIKSSLIDYLKKQEIIKDYAFEGSAVQVLLDILAYNTMYQAYYMNMVANESFLDTAQRLESIISLVKPLGYVVPGKVSAVGTLKLRQGGLGTIIPRYSRFIGKNRDGIAFNFYSNANVTLDQDGEGEIEVYEGKQLVSEIPTQIDISTQKGFLSGVDIDLRTLKVEVKKEDSETYEEWEYSSNINTNITNESKVFFLERSELGYFLVFAGRNPTGAEEQVGERINENDLVRVSYVVSGGSDGNGCSGFSIPASSSIPGTIDTVYISSGGLDEPDIEEIKFFAPKWFAAQDRAVTVNDCKAILAEKSGLTREDFNVFGGEELEPPLFGRVFVTLTGDQNQSTVSAALEALTTLKEKSIVSILPEFITTTEVVANLNGTVNYRSGDTTRTADEMRSLFVSAVLSQYPRSTYNTSVSISSLNQILSRADSAFSLNPQSVNLTISSVVSPDRTLYSVRQPVQESSLIFTASSSLSETYPELTFSAYGTLNRRGEQRIRAYTIDPNTGVIIVVSSDVGKFVPSEGSFRLNPDIITESAIYTVTPESQTVDGKFDLKLGVNANNISVVAI